MVEKKGEAVKAETAEKTTLGPQAKEGKKKTIKNNSLINEQQVNWYLRFATFMLPITILLFT